MRRIEYIQQWTNVRFKNILWLEEEVICCIRLITLKNNDNVVEVDDVWVAENQRGNGYGDMMMTDILQTTQYETLKLKVRKDNAVAINMYSKHGFKYYKDDEVRDDHQWMKIDRDGN